MRATESSGDDWTTIIALTILLIIFVVTLHALGKSSFRPVSRFALAVCVSTLSVIGLTDTFGGSRGSLRLLLIPYQTMAISIFGVGLLMIIMAFLCFLGFGRKAGRDRVIERDVDRSVHSSRNTDVGRRAGVRPIIHASDIARSSRSRTSAAVAEIRPRQLKTKTRQVGPLADAPDIQRKMRKQ